MKGYAHEYSLFGILKDIDESPENLETSRLIEMVIKGHLILHDLKDDPNTQSYDIDKYLRDLKERMREYCTEIDIRIPRDNEVLWDIDG